MFTFIPCLQLVMGGHRLEPSEDNRDAREEMIFTRLLRHAFATQRLLAGTTSRLRANGSGSRRALRPVSQIGRCSVMLRGQLLPEGKQVRAFLDMALALERRLKWLEGNGSNEVIREEVLSTSPRFRFFRSSYCGCSLSRSSRKTKIARARNSKLYRPMFSYLHTSY